MHHWMAVAGQLFTLKYYVHSNSHSILTPHTHPSQTTPPPSTIYDSSILHTIYMILYHHCPFSPSSALIFNGMGTAVPPPPQALHDVNPL